MARKDLRTAIYSFHSEYVALAFHPSGLKNCSSNAADVAVDDIDKTLLKKTMCVRGSFCSCYKGVRTC